MEHRRSALSDFDVLDALKGRWLAIDATYRKAFAVSLACTVGAYFIFVAHYLMHNHYPRFPWIDHADQFANGRWFAVFFNWLAGFASLPVMQPVMAMVLLCAAALMAVSLWQRGPLTLRTLACSALAVTLYPANLAPFYFTWMMSHFIGAALLAVLAMYVASSMSVWRIVAGAVSATLALATYQPSLSVMTTVFMSLAVVELVESEGPLRGFWGSARRVLLPRLLAVVLGGAGYAASLPVLGLDRTTASQLTSMPLDLLPIKLVLTVMESVSALFYTQPDIQWPLRAMLLLSVAVALGLALGRALVGGGGPAAAAGRAALMLAALLGLVVATKAMYIVSASNEFAQYRYNLSMGFFHGFCVFLLLTLARPRLLAGAAAAFAVVLLVMCAQADLVRQGVLLRGQAHDLALANRILYRIESLPDLELSRPYTLVRVGRYPAFRLNALRSGGHPFDRGGDEHMDSGEISALWNPEAVMRQLGSRVRWNNGASYMADYGDIMRRARELCEAQGRRTWPDASSVFIHDDWIVVYMEEGWPPPAR